MVYDILAIPLFTVALPIVSPFNLNTTVPPFNAVEPLFTVALTVMLLPAELVISLTLVVVFWSARTLSVLDAFDEANEPVPL